jgi:hypothetical protein
MRSAEVSITEATMSVNNRLLLCCGLIAGPLFIGGIFLQG